MANRKDMKIPIQPPKARGSEFRYLVVFDFRPKYPISYWTASLTPHPTWQLWWGL